MSELNGNPSEKETEQNKETISYPSGKLGAVTRKCNNIDKYLTDFTEEKCVAVNILWDEYKTKVDNFVKACNEEVEKNVEIEELENFVFWKNSNLKNIDTFKRKVLQWMTVKIDDVRPEDSASQVSKGSNASITSSLLNRKIENETKKKIIEKTQTNKRTTNGS
jgi:hypothetical protein